MKATEEMAQALTKIIRSRVATWEATRSLELLVGQDIDDELIDNWSIPSPDDAQISIEETQEFINQIGEHFEEYET